MNSAQVQTATETQSIQLIDGIFTPAQASEVINDMLNKKINYHKLQILKMYECNNQDPCTFDRSRLEALKIEKERLNKILSDEAIQGKRLSIEAMVNIDILD